MQPRPAEQMVWMHHAALGCTLFVFIVGLLIAAMLTDRPPADVPPDPGLQADDVLIDNALVRLVPTASIEGVSGEPIIRVRVKKNVLAITATAPLLTIEAAGSVPLIFDTGDEVSVDRSADKWTIRAGRAEVLTGVARISLHVPDGTMTIDGNRYAGPVYLEARTDTSSRAFDVVEHLPLEAYLPGVIARELVPGWDIEAFRAQAIAARSYAIHERLRSATRTGRRHDIESTTSDQVYGGATKNSRAHDAVRSTRGIVVADGPRVLRAYYSSTCGGRPASAADIWPTGVGWEFNSAGPLQSPPRSFACEASPRFDWSLTRSRANLEKRLKAYGKRMGFSLARLNGLKSIDSGKISATRRPVEYIVTQRDGKTYTISGDHLRLACNESVRGVKNVTSRTRVYSGDLEFRFNGSSVTINGHGFGHGVGLCQYCAQGFAKEGRDWFDMLTVFYPGARVVRAY